MAQELKSPYSNCTEITAILISLTVGEDTLFLPLLSGKVILHFDQSEA